MFVTVMSGATLDAVTPEMALSGSVFSLACADILMRALSVVSEGKDIPDEGSDDHPPSKMRASQLVDGFHSLFEVRYAPDYRSADLSIRPALVNPLSVDKDVREHVRSGAFSYANALLIIWQDVRERLMKDFASGRPLHKMWTDS
ncbi:MAG: hypothetical protein MZV65_21300 [Chromatiales bacterium]|nr:hypothetical protein [Chromatiales bacterium]